MSCEPFASLGRKRIALILVAGLATFVCCLPSWSQGTTGRILGVVRDPSGAVVAGANVTVLDVTRGVARTLVTDSGGEYVASNLLPGQYRLTVQASGFAGFDRQNIAVVVGQDVRVDASLAVGAQTQTVTVTEAAPAINTTNATLSSVVDNRALSELPLSGRNYLHLLLQSPNVVMQPGGGPDSYVSNGQRSSANAYLVEGLFSTNINTGASPILGAGSGSGGPEQANLLPVDSIQEINVMDNPKAEFGGEPGAYINMGFKSGTNAIHGTAYAFGRDSALEARNAFLTTKQVDEVHQWGVSLGGPIKKDKLFYFGNYEYQQYSITTPKVASVPTTASLGGGAVGAAGSFPDAIAQMNAASVAVSQLSLNMAGCTNPASHPTNPALISCDVNKGLFGQSAPTTSETVAFPTSDYSNNLVGKVDYVLSDKNTMNVVYAYGDGKPIAAGTTAVLEPYWQGQYHIRSQVARLDWVFTPNSEWVNEAVVGTDRIHQSAYSGDCLPAGSVPAVAGSPDYATQFGLVSGVPACGIPTFTIGSYTAAGSTLGTNVLTVFYQGQDVVSRIIGNHALKFGGGVRQNDWTGTTGPSAQRGAIDFVAAGNLTALQAFLAGIPNPATTFNTVAVGNPTENFNWKSYWTFIQDDWRIAPKVTVNLGLRYEFEAPMRSATNAAGGFDPNSSTGLSQQTNSQSLWKSTKKDLGPRLGVAWDVTGKGTTVVRAAGGVFFLPFITQLVSTTAAVYAVPTGGTYTLANGSTVKGTGTLNNGTLTGLGSVIQANWALNTLLFGTLPTSSTISCGNGIAPQPAPCSLTVVDPDLTPGIVGEWNLGVQHAITSDITLDVNYVGNHGANEQTLEDLNQPTPGTTAGEQQRRPYYSQFPYLGSIGEIVPIAISNYNALQVGLKQRAVHGLSYGLNYTWGHALDMASESHGYIAQPSNPTSVYGNSEFDYRHRITFEGTYLIPGKKSPGQMLEGWQMNTTVHWFNQTPYEALDTKSDFSGTGEKVDRWDLFGNNGDFTANNQIFPCYGITGSSFAATPGCTTVPIPAGAATAAQKVANMPGQCITASAGLPVNPSVPSSDKNATGLAALSNFGCYLSNGSVIVPPAQGTYGNMGRNQLRAPGFGEWDLSVVKNWNLTERVKFQFRAECFNVLNSTILGGPGSKSGANSTPLTPNLFGVSPGTPDVAHGAPVFGTGGPRKVQLGAKFIF